jgi:hypothetical protein
MYTNERSNCKGSPWSSHQHQPGVSCLVPFGCASKLHADTVLEKSCCAMKGIININLPHVTSCFSRMNELHHCVQEEHHGMSCFEWHGTQKYQRGHWTQTCGDSGIKAGHGWVTITPFSRLKVEDEGCTVDYHEVYPPIWLIPPLLCSA